MALAFSSLRTRHHGSESPKRGRLSLRSPLALVAAAPSSSSSAPCAVASDSTAWRRSRGASHVERGPAISDAMNAARRFGNWDNGRLAAYLVALPPGAPLRLLPLEATCCFSRQPHVLQIPRRGGSAEQLDSCRVLLLLLFLFFPASLAAGTAALQTRRRSAESLIVEGGKKERRRAAAVGAPAASNARVGRSCWAWRRSGRQTGRPYKHSSAYKENARRGGAGLCSGALPGFSPLAAMQPRRP